ncbi:hypothetical protein CLV78_101128 [Aliiruegeria haliotis]|uniref:Secreted protein n=1 Tax=Aliiruegeria haliotis TaxID=1280846 RepID=A0A2T0RXX7_9RHOB|nr:hypothetical protein [Aliiruegeria haliotis]PRY26035.1 hypothetical protein CLV78_101128 [Aliiruegeria haliotis]
MRRFVFVASAVAAIGLVGLTGPAAEAQAVQRYSDGNNIAVTGTAQGFEVFGRAGSTGADYMCAAGEFSHVRLNARNNDRMVMTRPLGPSPTTPGRQSMEFVLLGPDARTPWGGSILQYPRRAGLNRSVGHARGLCSRSD